jgi:hypothetical protein
MIQKKCLRCGEKKPLDEFNKDSSQDDGKCTRCKTCMKYYRDKYRAENPEHFKKISRASLNRRRKEKYPLREPVDGNCSRCGEFREAAEFYRNKNSPTGRDSWCKDCRRTYHRAYTYGISEEKLKEFTDIGECQICGATERLFIDHCHNKNEVRGLLCINCNFGIGNFRDSKELLIRAAEYLSS